MLELVSGGPRDSARAGSLNPQRERLVRDMLRLRRQRTEFFGPDLFADPAWDILLELYASALGGLKQAVSTISPLIQVPQSTVIRWIDKLEEDGWLYRVDDQFDRRRIWVQLSEKGFAQLNAYFEAWAPRAV